MDEDGEKGGREKRNEEREEEVQKVKRIINPRRACTARVNDSWSVCLCVCLLLNISFYTRLFVPQTIITFPAADEGRKF